MPEIRVSRLYRFSAAHRLHSPVLTDEKNRDVYGKCNYPFGHGHDYTLEVSVYGRFEPRAGRLVVVDELDALVRTVILERMDRRNLNVDVNEFVALVPTTENLAEVIAKRLADAWPVAFGNSSAQLEKVRIWETRRNIFETLAPLPAHAEGKSNEIAESCR